MEGVFLYISKFNSGTEEYVNAIAITSGDGWDIKDLYKASNRVGDVCPRPINGPGFKVWENGKRKDKKIEKSLEPSVLRFLTGLVEEVKVILQEEERIREEGLNAAIFKAVNQDLLKGKK